jgi:uncharacterized protein (TIGR02271 family)
MSINMHDPGQLAGAAVVGRDWEKLGSVNAVYLDTESGRPEWVAVVSGLFGTRISLVPLAQAEFVGADLRLPYDREQLKTAPHHDPGRELSPSDEAELFRHYGVPHGSESGMSQSSGITDEAQTTETSRAESIDADHHGDYGARADDTMTRSEERLRAGTRTRETGRVRLRKHVVTEHQQVTVPVSHEEVVVEREPVGRASAAGDVAPTISDEEREVVLHEERPVVEKEAEVVERLRLGTRTVTGEETVSGEVRKEEIEVDADRQPLRDGNRETS